jgi:hypothetical protein
MDEFRRLGLYNNRQLFDLNAVRMHLQVTTLSDIADAQGKKITKEVFEGMKPTDRYSKLKWPRQLVTTTKQWNLWKAALSDKETWKVEWSTNTGMEIILRPSDEPNCNINYRPCD